MPGAGSESAPIRRVGDLFYTSARRNSPASLNTVAGATIYLEEPFRMSVHSPKTSHLCRRRARGSLLTVTLSLGLLAASEPATAQIVPVCDRTPEVRDEIVRLVSGVKDCADVTEAHLAEIKGHFFDRGREQTNIGGFPGERRLPPPPVGELKTGDFSGLSSLRVLYLDRTQLSDLPEGIFSGLSSLEFLDLARNELSSLPEGIFSGLSSLEHLSLARNELSSLPEGIFSGLSSLEHLSLARNELSSLPEGIFSGLSSLEHLSLARNELSSLPEGIFSGLSSLEFLRLIYNPASPLPINVSLEWVDAGRFQARVHTGAPFEIRLPITVANGVFHEHSSHLTIPAGQETSDVVSLSRQPGTTAPVTVEIAQLPGMSVSYNGFALVRPAMPLTLLAPAFPGLSPFRQRGGHHLRVGDRECRSHPHPAGPLLFRQAGRSHCPGISGGRRGRP